MSETLNFQYCQKIVLFDEEDNVLLARRKGEADYDGVYSLIGGKMETTDASLVEGMRREKQEEIGRRAIVLIAPHLSFNILFRKKDGSSMVLPHLYALYKGGEIDLNEEYDDYKWVAPTDLEAFEPKIETIVEAVRRARQLRQIIADDELVQI